MPRMMAMCPIIFPTPAVKESGTCLIGIPEPMPRLKAAIANPSAGCRRSFATRSNSSSTVAATQASRYQS